MHQDFNIRPDIWIKEKENMIELVGIGQDSLNRILMHRH